MLQLVVHEADLSSVKIGFDNYTLDSIGAWCTADNYYSQPVLQILFENVVKIYGVGVGGPSDISLVTFPRNVRLSTKLLDGENWQYCRVAHTDVSCHPKFLLHSSYQQARVVNYSLSHAMRPGLKSAIFGWQNDCF